MNKEQAGVIQRLRQSCGVNRSGPFASGSAPGNTTNPCPLFDIAALAIDARIFPAEYHIPSGAVVIGFFPGLLDLVWIEPYYFHSVQYAFPIGSVTCAFKFRRAGRDLARTEYMNPSLVVGEHSIPALIVRAVSEDILTVVAPSSVPVLDDDALVER